MLITWCGWISVSMDVFWVERVGFSGGVDGRGGALRIVVVLVFRGGDRRSNGSAFDDEEDVRFAPILEFFGETPLLIPMR